MCRATLKALWLAVALGGVVTTAVGCGQREQKSGSARLVTDAGVTDGQKPPSEDLVEIFSWWIAPGEAEALQALLEVNRQSYEGMRIFNAAKIDKGNGKEVLAKRLAEDHPPDLFQANAGDVRAFLEKNPGKLASLDGFFDRNKLRPAVLPEIIQAITIGGKIYSMPVSVHRSNALFFNKEVMVAYNVEPPTSVEGFLEACKKLKAAGITPVATAYQGWIQRLMFNSLAMGVMGARHFNEYFSGVGPRDDESLRKAIDVYDEVLLNYVNKDDGNPNFGWTNAAELMYSGKAAMYLHGNWVTGFLLQLGWEPGLDFGAVGSPGASELFGYELDIFAMPAHGPNPKGTENFMATIASPEGQVAFARRKGSSPVRLDVPRDRLDELSRETLDALEHAKIRVLVPTRNEWDDALGKFSKDHDKAALLKAFSDFPPRN